MCFETIYNAIKALVEMDMLLMRTISFEDRKIIFDTLSGALLTIGQPFNEEEVSKILRGMQSEESMSDSGWLCQFLNVMDCNMRRSMRPYS